MRLPLLALLLTSCARPAPAPVEPMHWQQDAYPIELRVSSSLDACQAASVVAAVSWLESRTGRDLFEPHTVGPHDLAVLGLWVEGVVSIAPTPALARPGRVGEAMRTLYPHTRTLHSVTIEVVGCSPWVIAHELGHSLGLDHVADSGALMFPVALGGWQLSDDEIARLAL